MTQRKPPTARRTILAALASFVPLASALAAESGAVNARVPAAGGAASIGVPTLTPAQRPREPPMRIVRVTSSDTACAPDCPEWISAEGTIVKGSAGAFAQVVADLHGRRLPVLISSRGGSVRDALEMGVKIRNSGLAVAVARTLIENCPERAPACPDARGRSIIGGAACASSCIFVLAAGAERLVAPVAPLVGVHQITTVMQEAEGVAGLKRTVKIYEQDWVDRTVGDYLTEMGVGEPVMSLLRQTPAANIRWLSLDEVRASGLATGALDAAEPVVAAGANGLDGHAFDDRATPDVMTAKIPDASGSSVLGLRYRRGGGALELTLSPIGQAQAADPAFDWSLAWAAGPPILLKAAEGGTARALLPRARLCALRDAGLLAASPKAGASPAHPLTFDGARATGIVAILGEACPSSQ